MPRVSKLHHVAYAGRTGGDALYSLSGYSAERRREYSGYLRSGGESYGPNAPPYGAAAAQKSPTYTAKVLVFRLKVSRTTLHDGAVSRGPMPGEL